MLTVENTCCILIDVQEKLWNVMHEKKKLAENLDVFLKGIRVLGIPLIWFEQNPGKLGSTLPQLSEILEGYSEPIPKLSFSCCTADGGMERIEGINRKNVLIAGIESHVCVYQTAGELIESGYTPSIVGDCVTSRTPENREAGLNRIRDMGGAVVSTEMVLFELLKKAEGDKFREILKIVK